MKKSIWIVLLVIPVVVIALLIKNTGAVMALGLLWSLIIIVTQIIISKRSATINQQSDPPKKQDVEKPKQQTPIMSEEAMINSTRDDYPWGDERMRVYKRMQRKEAERKAEAKRLQNDETYYATSQMDYLINKGNIDEIEQFLKDYETLVLKSDKVLKLSKLWFHLGWLYTVDRFLFGKAKLCYDNGHRLSGGSSDQYSSYIRILEEFREITDKINKNTGAEKAKAFLKRAFHTNATRKNAIADMNAAAKEWEYLIEIQFFLGVQHQKKFRYNDAINCYSRVLELKSDNRSETDTHFRRAQCYMELKQYEEAVADLSIVIEKNEDDYDAYNCRYSAYTLLGKKKEAEMDSKKYDELTEDHYYGGAGPVEVEGPYSRHLNCNGFNFHRFLG